MKKKLLIILLVVLLIALVVCVFSFFRSGNQQKLNGNKADVIINSCEASNGSWLDQYSECEYISGEWCEENGGEFNECASPCRHNPMAEICAMVCVPVCVFNSSDEEVISKSDAKNTSYMLVGKTVKLSNGEAIIDNGISRSVVRVWDESSPGDLDSDGENDVAVVLTEETGGSGTFFYVAVAVAKNGVYHGSNGVFVGDRIAPENISIVDGLVLLNYADRRPEDAMSVRPSQAESAWFEMTNEGLKRISAKLINGRNDQVAIKLYSPDRLGEIRSPFEVSGEARGNWFFEASFPVMLVNWDGLIIAHGIAQAQSDWMTEDFVPFKAKLEFEKPDYKNNGALILKKDNPSGLPQYDDALEVPIFFK